MSNDLESLIRRIGVRIREDDPTVIEDAVKLAEQYPDEPRVWRTLANAYIHEDNYVAAIEAITQVIKLEPRKSVAFSDRGWYLLSQGDYERAIADFSDALVLAEQMGQESYYEGLYFMRAEAFVQVGKKSEALADLAYVREDYRFWTTELRTKADLLALCADAASPENDGRYTGKNDSPIDDEPVKWELPDVPDEEEAIAAEKLGAEGLAKADATLLKCVRQRWSKVARVLCDAIEADDFEIAHALVCVYLRRLIELADVGAIEVAGNIRRPRFSEVRLPDAG